MKIEIADKAGFCFGVARAVKIAYGCTQEPNQVFTYGKLIHNRDVTEDLQRQGVRCAAAIEEIPEGSTAIIRAHGISQQEQDALYAKGIHIVDATCPYVKKIHNVVSKAYQDGRQIVIVGDGNHPEVKGINGWCQETAIIVERLDDAALLEDMSPEIPIALVAQTTIRADVLKFFSKILKKHFTNAQIFDTICSATDQRQKAAANLAARSDCMIVVGGADSSNTRKLYEVCQELCSDTFAVENSKELKNYMIQGAIPTNKNIKVGITAGASTPDSVIKEVYLTMAETNEMNFAEALEETLKPLNSGEVVKGVVIGITPTEVQVDIGNKYDGVIPFDELTNDTNANINDLVKMGEEVDVYVVHVSDRDGMVTLSKKKIDAVRGLEEIRKAYEDNVILTGRVMELVKGGVVIIAQGVRVFIPASECAERFIADLGVLLNTEQRFKIIKMDQDRRGRHRVVGSIKVVLKEEKEKAAEAFWAEAEVGKKYTGVVRSLTSFGAFLDVGGVDGLLHISELGPGKIKHPSEVLKVGDEMEVYIRELNKAENRVSLVKELKEQKEAKFWEGIEIGKHYTGPVKSLTSFGAFVDLGGVDGLVHISELSWHRVKHPSEVVKVGDMLDVYIKDFNREAGKISLGYKKEEDSPWIQATKDMKVGDVIKCKIVRILPFGAFAEVAPYVDGLIHISQIAKERVGKPSDVLSIGQVVDAKIVEINDDTKQIGLSMKAVAGEEEAAEAHEEEVHSYTEESSFTLGDILDSVEAAVNEPEAEEESAGAPVEEEVAAPTADVEETATEAVEETASEVVEEPVAEAAPAEEISEDAVAEETVIQEPVAEE